MNNPTVDDIDRDSVRRALATIVEQNHGVLNPRQVLDAAREPTSILHGYFEWNDERASELYRLAQVGALVRRVRLKVIRSDETQRSITITTTRAYQSRPSQRTKDGGYEDVASIIGDPVKRGELLASVVRELASYRRRYAELVELDGVWTAVDDAIVELLPTSSSAAPGGDEAHDSASPV